MSKIQSEWKISSDKYYPYCDNCKCEPPCVEMTDFCPKCGAEMKRKDKLTNFARIKRMSIEEMAEFIYELLTICNETNNCKDCKYNNNGVCMSENCAKRWLESEVQNDQ